MLRPQPLNYAPPQLREPLPPTCTAALLGAMLFLLLSLTALAPGLHNEHPLLFVALGAGVLATLAVRPAFRYVRHRGAGRFTARVAVVMWTFAFAITALGVWGATFGEDSHVTGRRLTYCTARLRYIGQAMTLYADDHGGKYPDSLADLLRATPDMHGEQFLCPAVVPYGATASRDAVIGDLISGKNQQHVYLGKGMTADKVTPDAVLVHDNPSNWSAHGGGLGVLFGDGSSFHLERREAQKLLAELATGHNPPRPDHFQRP